MTMGSGEKFKQSAEEFLNKETVKPEQNAQNNDLPKIEGFTKYDLSKEKKNIAMQKAEQNVNKFGRKIIEAYSAWIKQLKVNPENIADWKIGIGNRKDDILSYSSHYNEAKKDLHSCLGDVIPTKSEEIFDEAIANLKQLSKISKLIEDKKASSGASKMFGKLFNKKENKKLDEYVHFSEGFLRDITEELKSIDNLNASSTGIENNEVPSDYAIAKEQMTNELKNSGVHITKNEDSQMVGQHSEPAVENMETQEYKIDDKAINDYVRLRALEKIGNDCNEQDWRWMADNTSEVKKSANEAIKGVTKLFRENKSITILNTKGVSNIEGIKAVMNSAISKYIDKYALEPKRAGNENVVSQEKPFHIDEKVLTAFAKLKSLVDAGKVGRSREDQKWVSENGKVIVREYENLMFNAIKIIENGGVVTAFGRKEMKTKEAIRNLIADFVGNNKRQEVSKGVNATDKLENVKYEKVELQNTQGSKGMVSDNFVKSPGMDVPYDAAKNIKKKQSSLVVAGPLRQVSRNEDTQKLEQRIEKDTTLLRTVNAKRRFDNKQALDNMRVEVQEQGLPVVTNAQENIQNEDKDKESREVKKTFEESFNDALVNKNYFSALKFGDGTNTNISPVTYLLRRAATSKEERKVIYQMLSQMSVGYVHELARNLKEVANGNISAQSRAEYLMTSLSESLDKLPKAYVKKLSLFFEKKELLSDGKFKMPESLIKLHRDTYNAMIAIAKS